MAGPVPIPGSPDPSSGGSSAASPARQGLAVLRDTLRATQETVLLARRAPADPRELRTARVAHLLAMTQFELALTSCHLPIPPRLQLEARLLRSLLA